ncbi:MAG TPA: TolC family protein [Burkholderiaceae bacterium]|jgi:outer membrane protein TolC|nr:TolC family protein [Burkholderiaceae bacterium]
MALGVLCACAALAQPAPSFNNPTLAQAVEAAWQHRKAAQAAQDRLRRAGASGLAARSWLPDAPALELSVRSDRWHANEGVQEREAGIRLPLWLPGQRDARIAAADADVAWAEATVAADRLKLAGEVRERAWELAAAQGLQRQAEEQVQSLKALADDVARRVKAGDLARADLLEALAESLAADGQLHEARSRLAAAQAQWSALTGQVALPDPAEPARAAAVDGIAAHPALKLAELGVERARRALEVTQRSTREAPELGIGLRQDRADRGQPLQNSVALSLRWTFGTDARNEPLRAAAFGELEAARAESLALRQQLAGEQAAASAALDAARAQLASTTQRADVLQQRAALVDAAFNAGEVGLPALLRARSAAAHAVTAVTLQQAALGLALARLHQALGLLP